METEAEIVDILVPPYFTKSGRHKTQEQAWRDQDWIGTFNLWIIQNDPVPAIVYQIRSPESTWAPNKLDATAGGHYRVGEERADGLREVVEELGKHYEASQLTFVGRKLHVAPDVQGFERRNIVDISFIVDNAPLQSYKLQPEEVYAICACPITDLIRAHSDPSYTFTAEILKNDGSRESLTVSKSSFPDNWDDYHFKIALLAERFVKGERHLIY